jgi:hypothetical protein
VDAKVAELQQKVDRAFHNAAHSAVAGAQEGVNRMVDLALQIAEEGQNVQNQHLEATYSNIKRLHRIA